MDEYNRDNAGRFASKGLSKWAKTRTEALKVGQQRAAQRLDDIRNAGQRSIGNVRSALENAQRVIQQHATEAKATGHSEHAKALAKAAKALDPVKVHEDFKKSLERLQAATKLPEGPDADKARTKATRDLERSAYGKVAQATKIVGEYQAAREFKGAPQVTDWSNDSQVRARTQAFEDRDRKAVELARHHPVLKAISSAHDAAVEANVGSLGDEAKVARAERRVAAYGRALKRWSSAP